LSFISYNKCCTSQGIFTTTALDEVVRISTYSLKGRHTSFCTRHYLH